MQQSSAISKRSICQGQLRYQMALLLIILYVPEEMGERFQLISIVANSQFTSYNSQLITILLTYVWTRKLLQTANWNLFYNNIMLQKQHLMIVQLRWLFRFFFCSMYLSSSLKVNVVPENHLHLSSASLWTSFRTENKLIIIIFLSIFYSLCVQENSGGCYEYTRSYNRTNYNGHSVDQGQFTLEHNLIILSACGDTILTRRVTVCWRRICQRTGHSIRIAIGHCGGKRFGYLWRGLRIEFAIVLLRITFRFN